jgi:hypothetical protein
MREKEAKRKLRKGKGSEFDEEVGEVKPGKRK